MQWIRNILIVLYILIVAQPQLAMSETPPKPFRVIYVEGGPFTDFQLIFKGMSLGLQRLGLIANGNVPIPSNTEYLDGMWMWMNKHAGGHKIEFLKDGFYSADYNHQQFERMCASITRRILEQKDVDAILSFGTMAGKKLAGLRLPVPVIVSSVTNSVEAGIVPSVEDSGNANLVSLIDPERFKCHIFLFHTIFKFKKLGIAYEDTPTGKHSIALQEIESAAKEREIELVRCTDMFDIEDVQKAAERLAICHRKLVEKGAEAVYLTYNVGITEQTMERVLEPLLTAQVPTFSQQGGAAVKMGALLSIAQSSDSAEGEYSAYLLSEIMQGKKAGSLSQRFETPLSLAINVRTAKRINWKPALDVLVAVDEFFN